MPELPEVETIRRDLDGAVVGRTVEDVVVTGARSVRRRGADDLRARLVGRSLTGTGRRGKHLLVTLDSGHWLVVHLRMSGQLEVVGRETPPRKHTHVVVRFADGADLRFVDPRTFGEVFVADPENLAAEAPGLAATGWDPLEEPLSPAEFARLVSSRRQRLKSLLTDQRVVAGLGNIYSDEILHVARLRHDRPADSLSRRELRRLYGALHEVVHQAVAARGSSLADAQYVDLAGRPGTFQLQHQVYGRAGQACRRCRTTIQRARWGGRSTFFCPRCQR